MTVQITGDAGVIISAVTAFIAMIFSIYLQMTARREARNDAKEAKAQALLDKQMLDAKIEVVHAATRDNEKAIVANTSITQDTAKEVTLTKALAAIDSVHEVANSLSERLAKANLDKGLAQGHAAGLAEGIAATQTTPILKLET